MHAEGVLLASHLHAGVLLLRCQASTFSTPSGACSKYVKQTSSQIDAKIAEGSDDEPSNLAEAVHFGVTQGLA